MVATIGIILLFVVTGLGVVLLAFGGGASGAREQILHSQTPIGRRVAFAVVVLVTLVFGIGVPALLMSHNATSQANSSIGGVDLNDSQVEGRELFAEHCATCHTLKAAGAVGKVGPNLDAMRPPAVLTVDAIAKGRARGLGQMPAELVDSVDAKKVAGFIAATAGR